MQSIDTTEGPLVRRSVQLAWPAVLQAFLVNFYAFNDFLFVGFLHDPAATAALSSCFAVLLIHYMLLRIVATGGTTLIAQFTGAKRIEEVAATFRQSLVATAVWSMLVGLVLYTAMDPIVAMNNASEAVGLKIADYLSVIALGTPAFAAMLVVDGTFRARGNTTMPLVLETASLLINTVLNYALVLGNCGFPAMGIGGAALATMISRAIPGLVGLALIFGGILGFEARGRLSAWIPTVKRLRRMISIGVFDSLGGIIYGLVYLVLNRLAGQLGPAAQGGLGAGLRGIEWVAFAFGDGFMVAAVTIVGQNVGANKPERVLRGAWVTAILSAISCQLVGVLFLLIPGPLSGLVTDDPQTLAYATEYVYLIGWFMWAVGFEMALYGAFVGAGKPAVTMMVSGFSNLLRIPLACALVFGPEWIIGGTIWGLTGLGTPPPTQGWFAGLGWCIAITACLKAVFYFAWVTIRKRIG